MELDRTLKLLEELDETMKSLESIDKLMKSLEKFGISHDPMPPFPPLAPNETPFMRISTS